MDEDPQQLSAETELHWFRRDGVAMVLRLTGHGVEYYSRDPYYGHQQRAGFQTFGELVDYGGRYDLPEALEEVLVDQVQDLEDPEDRVGALLSPVSAPRGAFCTTRLDRTRVELERSRAIGPWALIGSVILAALIIGALAGPFGVLSLVPGALVLAGGLSLSLWGTQQAVELDGRQVLLETRTLYRRRSRRLPLENLTSVGIDAGALVLETVEGERIGWGRGLSHEALAWLADGIDQAVFLRGESVGSASPTQAPEELERLLPEAARGSNERR